MKKASADLYQDFFEQIVGRKETQLFKDDEIQHFFIKERILIIGAGGSIGSALARRLISAKLTNIFFLDRDESALHGLALELSNKAAAQSENCFVGDIRDRQSIEDVIIQIKPTVVIHAAALKHLVILERFPREGFLTNIIGTLNVAELCAKHKVQHFVNISTDKAANPISVLGKTKKLAELISEEVFAGSKLQQCSVRFGNVFASRGSVIETFIHQIKNQLPVTISHLEVARFFMSHNEAANLVLAAASLEKSGTYIQNMGEEILIKDVVDRIATYLNMKPIIKIVGLKNGEKMHEELFDSAVSETKFQSISRSDHPLKRGLVNDVHKINPSSNEEASEQIAKLISKYL